MIGAIVGDIAGSTHEFKHFKTADMNFPLFPEGSKFTDDSILTVALADSLLSSESYGDLLKVYAKTYPYGGYGGRFVNWLRSGSKQPYDSFGNGSAMRTSAIGYFYDDLDNVLEEAEKNSAYTHSHPEGIKGAQVVSGIIFLSRTGSNKDDILKFSSKYYSGLTEPLENIRRGYSFDATCQGTVPESIMCLLESNNFEHAVRLAVSLGGDSDTLGTITGSMAEAYYNGVPEDLANTAYDLSDDLIREVVTKFFAKTKPDFLVGKWKENKDKYTSVPAR